MNKQDIINYAVETPGNTNKAVLSSMLDEFAVSDNKTEIELSATENKVYTPETGKVYNKVTVNVPAPAPGSECEILEFTVEELGYNSTKTVAEIIADNETTPQAIKFTSGYWFEEGYVQGNTIYKLIRIDAGDSASGLTFGAIEMLTNGSASETIVARGRSNNEPLSLTLMA